MGLAFTPDGKGLVTGSNDTESRIVGEKPEKGSMRLWDVATGRERRRFPVEGFDVQSIAVSPDGRLLAAGVSDQTIRIYDLTTGQERTPRLGPAPRRRPAGRSASAGILTPHGDELPGVLARRLDPRVGLMRDGEHRVDPARRCLLLGRRPGKGTAPSPGAPGMGHVAELLPGRPDAGLDRFRADDPSLGRGRRARGLHAVRPSFGDTQPGRLPGRLDDLHGRPGRNHPALGHRHRS